MKADTASCTYYRLSDALDGVICWLSNPPSPTISTGLRELDSVLQGGLQVGTVSAVAGRPSMGHTEFARQAAFHTAQQGSGVLYFSLDLSRYAIALRGLAELLDVDLHWLRTPHNQPDIMDLLSEYPSKLAALSDLPMLIDDTPTLKPEELCERVVAMCRLPEFQETPVKLVIVDSLQSLYSSPSPSADLVKPTMLMLDDLARNENIHILCTVSVLRHVDNRESHEPKLYDLWGDGMVERFCDPVLAIYRDSYYCPPDQIDDRDSADIFILRNSMPGVTACVMASFCKGRFSNAKDLQKGTSEFEIESVNGW